MAKRNPVIPVPVSEDVFKDMFSCLTDMSGTTITATYLNNMLADAFAGYSTDQAGIFKLVMDREPIIAAHMQTRILSVSGLPWRIQGSPNSEKNTTLTKVLEDAGIHRLANHLLQAIPYGYSGAFTEWASAGSSIKSFRPIDQTKWEFDEDGTAYLIDGNGQRHTMSEYGDHNLVFHQNESKSGIPSTLGLMRTLVWTYFFKMYAFKQKARFMEKYGIPFLNAKINDRDFADATKKAAIKEALRNVGADGIMVTTEGVAVESINTGQQGENANYQTWIDYLDKVYALVILGQIASAQAAGGFSQGQMQENVRMDLLQADAKGLEGTINNMVLRPLEWFKYGTSETSFKIDYEPTEDIKGLVDAVVSIKSAGYEVKREYIEDRLDIPLEKPPVPPGGSSPPVPPPLSLPAAMPASGMPQGGPPGSVPGLVPTHDTVTLSFSDVRVDDIISKSTLPEELKKEISGMPAKQALDALNRWLELPADDPKKKEETERVRDEIALVYEADLAAIEKAQTKLASEEQQNNPPAPPAAAAIDAIAPPERSIFYTNPRIAAQGKYNQSLVDFYKMHGGQPSPGEIREWRDSILENPEFDVLDLKLEQFDQMIHNASIREQKRLDAVRETTDLEPTRLDAVGKALSTKMGEGFGRIGKIIEMAFGPTDAAKKITARIKERLDSLPPDERERMKNANALEIIKFAAPEIEELAGGIASTMFVVPGLIQKAIQSIYRTGEALGDPARFQEEWESSLSDEERIVLDLKRKGRGKKDIDDAIVRGRLIRRIYDLSFSEEDPDSIVSAISIEYPAYVDSMDTRLLREYAAEQIAKNHPDARVYSEAEKTAAADFQSKIMEPSSLWRGTLGEGIQDAYQKAEDVRKASGEYLATRSAAEVAKFKELYDYHLRERFKRWREEQLVEWREKSAGMSPVELRNAYIDKLGEMAAKGAMLGIKDMVGDIGGFVSSSWERMAKGKPGELEARMSEVKDYTKSAFDSANTLETNTGNKMFDAAASVVGETVRTGIPMAATMLLTQGVGVLAGAALRGTGLAGRTAAEMGKMGLAARGLKAALTYAPTASSIAFWTGMSQQQIYRDMVARGYDPDSAWKFAAIVSVPYAMVETMVIGSLTPKGLADLRRFGQASIRSTVARIGADQAKRYVQENAEELVQDLMQEGTKAALSWWDKNSPKYNIKEGAKSLAEGRIRTAAVLGLLQLGSGSVEIGLSLWANRPSAFKKDAAKIASQLRSKKDLNRAETVFLRKYDEAGGDFGKMRDAVGKYYSKAENLLDRTGVQTYAVQLGISESELERRQAADHSYVPLLQFQMRVARQNGMGLKQWMGQTASTRNEQAEEYRRMQMRMGAYAEQKDLPESHMAAALMYGLPLKNFLAALESDVDLRERYERDLRAAALEGMSFYRWAGQKPAKIEASRRRAESAGLVELPAAGVGEFIREHLSRQDRVKNGLDFVVLGDVEKLSSALQDAGASPGTISENAHKALTANALTISFKDGEGRDRTVYYLNSSKVSTFAEAKSMLGHEWVAHAVVEGVLDRELAGKLSKEDRDALSAVKDLHQYVSSLKGEKAWWWTSALEEEYREDYRRQLEAKGYSGKELEDRIKHHLSIEKLGKFIEKGAYLQAVRKDDVISGIVRRFVRMLKRLFGIDLSYEQGVDLLRTVIETASESNQSHFTSEVSAMSLPDAVDRAEIANVREAIRERTERRMVLGPLPAKVKIARPVYGSFDRRERARRLYEAEKLIESKEAIADALRTSGGFDGIDSYGGRYSVYISRNKAKGKVGVAYAQPSELPFAGKQAERNMEVAEMMDSLPLGVVPVRASEAKDLAARADLIHRAAERTVTATGTSANSVIGHGRSLVLLNHRSELPATGIIQMDPSNRAMGYYSPAMDCVMLVGDDIQAASATTADMSEIVAKGTIHAMVVTGGIESLYSGPDAEERRMTAALAIARVANLRRNEIESSGFFKENRLSWDDIRTRMLAAEKFISESARKADPAVDEVVATIEEIASELLSAVVPGRAFSAEEIVSLLGELGHRISSFSQLRSEMAEEKIPAVGTPIPNAAPRGVDQRVPFGIHFPDLDEARDHYRSYAHETVALIDGVPVFGFSEYTSNPVTIEYIKMISRDEISYPGAIRALMEREREAAPFAREALRFFRRHLVSGFGLGHFANLYSMLNLRTPPVVDGSKPLPDYFAIPLEARMTDARIEVPDLTTTPALDVYEHLVSWMDSRKAASSMMLNAGIRGMYYGKNRILSVFDVRDHSSSGTVFSIAERYLDPAIVGSLAYMPYDNGTFRHEYSDDGKWLLEKIYDDDRKRKLSARGRYAASAQVIAILLARIDENGRRQEDMVEEIENLYLDYDRNYIKVINAQRALESLGKDHGEIVDRLLAETIRINDAYVDLREEAKVDAAAAGIQWPSPKDYGAAMHSWAVRDAIKRDSAIYKTYGAEEMARLVTEAPTERMVEPSAGGFRFQSRDGLMSGTIYEKNGRGMFRDASTGDSGDVFELMRYLYGYGRKDAKEFLGTGGKRTELSSDEFAAVIAKTTRPITEEDYNARMNARMASDGYRQVSIWKGAGRPKVQGWIKSDVPFPTVLSGPSLDSLVAGEGARLYSEGYDSIFSVNEEAFISLGNMPPPVEKASREAAAAPPHISMSLAEEPETAPPGESVTPSSRTYMEGVALAEDEKSKSRNVWVRLGAGKSNSRRVLAVQISSDLFNSGEPGYVRDYYDHLYGGAREGYARPGETENGSPDFWEIPEWIARLSAALGDGLDLYVVRDIAEAKRFLADAGYGSVSFSVMDANKSMVRKLLPSVKSRLIAVGGYAKEILNKSFGKDLNPSTQVYSTLDAYIKDLGKAPSPGTDYRLFAGSTSIPRLALTDGCLHSCAFCDVVPRGKVIERSDDDIERQLNSIIQLQPQLVYLNDKTFAQGEKWRKLPEINERLKAAVPGFKGFVVQTTGEEMSPEKMDREFLRQSGIRYVEIGLESANDFILALFNKPARMKDYVRAFAWARANNIMVIPNIMVGLHWGKELVHEAERNNRISHQRATWLIDSNTMEEKDTTYANTLAFLKKNKDIISHLNVFNLAVYAGSALARKVKARTSADVDENTLSKSFHVDPAVHMKWHENFVKFAEERLKEDPVVEATTMLAGRMKKSQLTAADVIPLLSSPAQKFAERIAREIGDFHAVVVDVASAVGGTNKWGHEPSMLITVGYATPDNIADFAYQLRRAMNDQSSVIGFHEDPAGKLRRFDILLPPGVDLDLALQNIQEMGIDLDRTVAVERQDEGTLKAHLILTIEKEENEYGPETVKKISQLAESLGGNVEIVPGISRSYERENDPFVSNSKSPKIRPDPFGIRAKAEEIVERMWGKGWAEISGKTPQMIRNVMELFDLAEEFKDKRFFYSEADASAKAFFGQLAWLFKDILAITSQMANGRMNTRSALEQILKGQRMRILSHAAGRRVSKAVEKYLRENVISGLKISEFARAMRGDLDAVVLDRWMIRLLFGLEKKELTKEMLAQGRALISTMAPEMGWKNSELQAALWAAAMVKFEFEKIRAKEEAQKIPEAEQSSWEEIKKKVLERNYWTFGAMFEMMKGVIDRIREKNPRYAELWHLESEGTRMSLAEADDVAARLMWLPDDRVREEIDSMQRSKRQELYRLLEPDRELPSDDKLSDELMEAMRRRPSMPSTRAASTAAGGSETMASLVEAPAITPAEDARYLELAKEPEKNKAELQRMVDEILERYRLFLQPYRRADARSLQRLAIPDELEEAGIIGINQAAEVFLEDEIPRLGGKIISQEDMPSLLSIRGGAVEHIVYIAKSGEQRHAYVLNEAADVDLHTQRSLITSRPLSSDIILKAFSGETGRKMEEFIREKLIQKYPIPSREPILRNGQGEVIPLSERLRAIKPDIRYSLGEAEDRPDSQLQSEAYMKGKQSLKLYKVRDDLDYETDSIPGTHLFKTPDGDIIAASYEDGQWDMESVYDSDVSTFDEGKISNPEALERLSNELAEKRGGPFQAEKTDIRYSLAEEVRTFALPGEVFPPAARRMRIGKKYYDIKFESDFDYAAYVVARKLKGAKAVIDAVKARFGFGEPVLRQHGLLVMEALRREAGKVAPDAKEIDIPAVGLVEKIEGAKGIKIGEMDLAEGSWYAPDEMPDVQVTAGMMAMLRRGEKGAVRILFPNRTIGRLFMLSQLESRKDLSPSETVRMGNLRKSLEILYRTQANPTALSAMGTRYREAVTAAIDPLPRGSLFIAPRLENIEGIAEARLNAADRAEAESDLLSTMAVPDVQGAMDSSRNAQEAVQLHSDASETGENSFVQRNSLKELGEAKYSVEGQKFVFFVNPRTGQAEPARTIPAGTLIVPIREISTGRIAGMEIIMPGPDSSPTAQPGMIAEGSGAVFGRLLDDGTIYLVVGWGNASVIREATGMPVVSVHQGADLDMAAAAIRRKYPNATLEIVCEKTLDGHQEQLASDAARVNGAILRITAVPAGEKSGSYLGLVRSYPSRENGISEVARQLQLAPDSTGDTVETAPAVTVEQLNSMNERLNAMLNFRETIVARAKKIEAQMQQEISAVPGEVSGKRNQVEVMRLIEGKYLPMIKNLYGMADRQDANIKELQREIGIRGMDLPPPTVPDEAPVEVEPMEVVDPQVESMQPVDSPEAAQATVQSGADEMAAISRGEAEAMLAAARSEVKAMREKIATLSTEDEILANGNPIWKWQTSRASGDRKGAKLAWESMDEKQRMVAKLMDKFYSAIYEKYRVACRTLFGIDLKAQYNYAHRRLRDDQIMLRQTMFDEMRRGMLPTSAKSRTFDYGKASPEEIIAYERKINTNPYENFLAYVGEATSSIQLAEYLNQFDEKIAASIVAGTQSDAFQDELLASATPEQRSVAVSGLVDSVVDGCERAIARLQLHGQGKNPNISLGRLRREKVRLEQLVNSVPVLEAMVGDSRHALDLKESVGEAKAALARLNIDFSVPLEDRYIQMLIMAKNWKMLDTTEAEGFMALFKAKMLEGSKLQDFLEPAMFALLYDNVPKNIKTYGPNIRMVYMLHEALAAHLSADNLAQNKFNSYCAKCGIKRNAATDKTLGLAFRVVSAFDLENQNLSDEEISERYRREVPGLRARHVAFLRGYAPAFREMLAYLYSSRKLTFSRGGQDAKNRSLNDEMSTVDEADFRYDEAMVAELLGKSGFFGLASAVTFAYNKEKIMGPVIELVDAAADHYRSSGREALADYWEKWMGMAYRNERGWLDRALRVGDPSLWGWVSRTAFRWWQMFRMSYTLAFNVPWMLLTQPKSTLIAAYLYGPRRTIMAGARAIPGTLSHVTQSMLETFGIWDAVINSRLIPAQAKRFVFTMMPAAADAAALRSVSLAVKHSRGEALAMDWGTQPGPTTRGGLMRTLRSTLSLPSENMEFFCDLTAAGAAVTQAKEMGYKGEDLKVAAMLGPMMTQSMFNRESRPLMLNNDSLRFFRPYNSYYYTMLNRAIQAATNDKPMMYRIKDLGALLFYAGAAEVPTIVGASAFLTLLKLYWGGIDDDDEKYQAWIAKQKIGRVVAKATIRGAVQGMPIISSSASFFIRWMAGLLEPYEESYGRNRLAYEHPRLMAFFQMLRFLQLGEPEELARAIDQAIVEDKDKRDLAPLTTWLVSHFPATFGIGGGIQVDRFIDTYLMISKNGGVSYLADGTPRYELKPHPYDYIQASLFGPNGSEAAQKYYEAMFEERIIKEINEETSPAVMQWGYDALTEALTRVERVAGITSDFGDAYGYPVVVAGAEDEKWFAAHPGVLVHRDSEKSKIYVNPEMSVDRSETFVMAKMEAAEMWIEQHPEIKLTFNVSIEQAAKLGLKDPSDKTAVRRRFLAQALMGDERVDPLSEMQEKWVEWLRRELESHWAD